MNVHHLIAVAIGGAIGAMGRYMATLWGTTLWPGKPPVATLCINTLGSFLMGVAFVCIVERGMLSDTARALLMSGLLGAFTTFSTFAMESLSLFHQGLPGWALIYAIATLCATLTAVALGYYLTLALI